VPNIEGLGAHVRGVRRPLSPAGAVVGGTQRAAKVQQRRMLRLKAKIKSISSYDSFKS